MMKYLNFWGIVFIFLTNSLAAQQGQIRISGRISDIETGEPLPGASILIEGTSTGTVTGLDGDYSIMVPGEGVVLVFGFIGFADQSITVGAERVINVRLKTDITSLDEVVVTTQARGQIGARNQQINSNTIKNVVAPDRLQENPDANAVEAIGRLPGISVIRSGGEGAGLVIRGLEPRYSSITLNGIELPSTGGNDRSTNISGISQYILQGVEVYKALTPDMEANSVAGTVNLILKETPAGIHTNVMAQGGYNNLNDYFGNYKVVGEVSNRFINDKLGVFLSLNAERVNRSVETMSAGYSLESTAVDILLKSSTLNKITTLKSRKSATLSLDYRLHPTTKLKLYGLYSQSGDDHERQSKTFNVSGAGSVGYQQHFNPYRNSEIMQAAFSGETKLKFLNLGIDYGAAYSYSKIDDPDSRDWSWSFKKSSSSEITTYDIRKQYPSDVIPLFSNNPDSLQNLHMNVINQSNTDLTDDNLTAYLNIEVPFKVGDFLSGFVKFGGKYRVKERFRDINTGYQNVGNNQFLKPMADEDIPWIVLSETNFEITAISTEDYMVTDFLDGSYDYGWYFRNDRLNEFTDWWIQTSNYYFSQGPEVWQPIFGERSKISFTQDMDASTMGDQDIKEYYRAGFLMSELNFGKCVMFMPGIRYEQVTATMKGFEALQPTLPPAILEPTPGTPTEAERQNAYWLPMIHARITPTDFLYFHFAYTNGLSRPDFNSISPNVFVNTGFQPFVYKSTDPELKPEFWTNYDAQVTLHNSKIGLLSVSGFYKTVEDKIWRRTYKRIRGDSLVPNFPDMATVNVTAWENHPYVVTLQGIEVEWQTSFWYLPRPFNFFTLYLNYTYTNSEMQYPYTRIDNVIPPEGGRPVAVRIDSSTTGPMLFQPRHIANGSLGFNLKNFNAWFSFQYNGEIFTGKNYFLNELDPLKEKFYRLDLQLTYDIPLKIPGDLQVLTNFANLSNFSETRRLRGDPRPTYIEAYGWTIDLGVRYRL